MLFSWREYWLDRAQQYFSQYLLLFYFSDSSCLSLIPFPLICFLRSSPPMLSLTELLNFTAQLLAHNVFIWFETLWASLVHALNAVWGRGKDIHVQNFALIGRLISNKEFSKSKELHFGFKLLEIQGHFNPVLDNGFVMPEKNSSAAAQTLTLCTTPTVFTWAAIGLPLWVTHYSPMLRSSSTPTGHGSVYMLPNAPLLSKKRESCYFEFISKTDPSTPTVPTSSS